MSITNKTIQLLQRLRDGEAVRTGEFASAQQKDIINFLMKHRGVIFTRIGKSRGSYNVTDPALFQELCSQYDPILRDLDAAARLIAGEVESRAEKVALFGNSKQDGADRTMKGFTILADRTTEIHYHGRGYVIGPKVGLHVVDRKGLVLPESATVVIVENAECLYDLRWTANVGLGEEDGPYVILCRFPICEEAKLWLKTLTNRILYFGDFDLAGIRIYESEFKRRLRNRISFILPTDLEKRIREGGNPMLYTKQVNEGFASIASPSGELKDLIFLIHNLHSCYEQEGYCLP